MNRFLLQNAIDYCSSNADNCFSSSELDGRGAVTDIIFPLASINKNLGILVAL